MGIDTVHMFFEEKTYINLSTVNQCFGRIQGIVSSMGTQVSFIFRVITHILGVQKPSFFHWVFGVQG